MFASQARLTLTVRFPATIATRPHKEEPKPGATLWSSPPFMSFSISSLSSTLVTDVAEPGTESKVEETAEDAALDIDSTDPLRSPYGWVGMYRSSCFFCLGNGGSGGTGGLFRCERDRESSVRGSAV